MLCQHLRRVFAPPLRCSFDRSDQGCKLFNVYSDGTSRATPWQKACIVSFRGQVLTSLKWTLIGRICTQIVSYGITLLVMRALLPANYGLVAIASIFTGIFAVVAEIGLGSTVVQRKSLSRLQFRQIFGIVLLSNMAVVIILFIIVAPLAAWVFAEPRV